MKKDISDLTVNEFLKMTEPKPLYNVDYLEALKKEQLEVIKRLQKGGE